MDERGVSRHKWAKAISPGNVIAGFRTCGVFPLNPKTIKILGVEDATEKHDTESSTDQASSVGGPRGASDGASSDGVRKGSSCISSDGAREGYVYASSDGTSRPSSVTHSSRTSPMTGTLEGTSFTDEQVKHFQIHYEEGTDVYIDPDYIQ